jgi:purine-cytosine permease-like protein
VEAHGIEPVSDVERRGRVTDLFWIWFAANIGLLGLVYGAIAVSFGLNFWQGLLAIVGGALSFLLVGVFTVAGRDGGAPMMTLSRAVFGIYGNILPNIVSWLSLVGWETISVITGTLALMALFGIFVHFPLDVSAIISMVLMLGLTILFGFLGQATLVVVQTWASYLFGVLTLVVIAMLVGHTNWTALWHHPAGSWLTGFLPALSIIIAGTGLSWANAAADYSRYIPRSAPRSHILWSSTLGAVIPLVVLMVAGMLFATGQPELSSSANPIAVIERALPPWMGVPYLLTAAGGLIAEADLSLYSSGLNLLNMFVPLPRYKTVLIDAAIMIAGTIYVVLVAQNFFGPFESFILLLGVGLAAWAGIFLIDQILFHREIYRATDMYPNLKAKRFRWCAVFAWLLAVAIGLLFTTSPFFTGPLAKGIFANSSLELLIAFALGLTLYLVLMAVNTRIVSRRSGAGIR